MVADDERLINETLRFWQEKTKTALTVEDARQIMNNVAELIEILEDWETDE